MKKNILAIILLCAFVFGNLGINVSASTYPSDNSTYKLYISPSGNDSNDGTVSSPLKTVKGALDKVDELRTQYSNRPFELYFRGGTYRVTETIQLKNKLGGENTLSFKAYPNETVVFSGAREIDISKVSALTDDAVIGKIRNYSSGNIYSINLSTAGITAENVGELYYAGNYKPYDHTDTAMNSEFYVDDTRMVPARYPNTGYITGYGVLSSGGTNDSDGVKISYDFGFDASSAWASAPYKRVFAEFNYDWAAYSLDIGEIGSQSAGWGKKVNYIKTAQAAPVYSGGDISEDGRYYVYNLVEELDYASEYYYDKDANVLYFYSATTPQKLEMTVVETMFTISGQKRISFEGITFEKMRGGPVYAPTSEYIDINNCVIRHCASDGGVVYFDRCTNSGVRNCDIYDISAGIALTHPTSEQVQSLTSSNNYIVNNEIHDFGHMDRNYKPAIRMAGVADVARNNKIYTSEHQAMAINGYNNIVEYNEFYDINNDTSDSGCIYAGQNFAKRGNKIRYNYFHDMPQGRQKENRTVYIDDFFSGTEVYGNIFENAEIAVMINKGYDNAVTYNAFINAGVGVKVNTEPNEANTLEAINHTNGTIYNNSTIYDTDEWREAFPQLFESAITDDNQLKWAHGNTVKVNFKVGTNGDNEFGNSSTQATLLTKNDLRANTAKTLDSYSGSNTKEKAISLINENLHSNVTNIGLLSGSYTLPNSGVVATSFSAYNNHIRVWGNADSDENVIVMLVKKTAGDIPSQSDIAYFAEITTDKDGDYEISLPYGNIDISEYEVRVSTGRIVQVEELPKSTPVDELVAIDINMLENFSWASLVAEITNNYNIDIRALGIKVYAAIYDDNKLVEAKMCDLSDSDISEQIQIPEGADYMKCFIWDSNYNPVKTITSKGFVVPQVPDENEFTYKISCWGDSLTYGSGMGYGSPYPTYLANILGVGALVKNWGVGGENTRTIAGRQGGMPFVLSNDITIPADRTPVRVAFLDGRPLVGSGDSGINSCYIDGIKGKLERDTNNELIFTRSTEGEEHFVNKGTTIVTNVSSYTGDHINIIFTGANDVGMLDRDKEGGSQNILNYQKAMIDKVEKDGGRYLVIGVADGEVGDYLDELKYLENLQETNFGKFYLNLREVLTTDLDIYEKEGINLTAEDLANMDNGVIPETIIHTDNIHFNANGYKALARAVYNKLVSLGMVVGRNN